MTNRAQELLAEVLKLSLAERAALAAEVLASIDGDEDPDGDPDEIDVDIAPGTRADATVDQDRRLSIAVTDRTQLLAYRITDGQRLTATAIVRVPPAGDATDLPPVMRPDAPCPPDLLRLSVGLEDPDDLYADLDRALRAANP